MTAESESRSILRVTVGLGGTVIILAGMYLMSGLVNQVFLAAFLALLMVPLSASLQERGLASKWANLVVLLIVLIATLALGAFLVLSLGSLVTDLPAYEQGLDATGRQIESGLASLGVEAGATADTVTAAGKRVLGIAAFVVVGMVDYAVDLVFVLLIFAFILFDAAGFRERMQRAFSTDNATLLRIQNSTSSVATYLRLLTTINLAIGVSDTVLLWLLGVPNAALWGLVAFITGYIPFIGYWIAMIPVLIVAYVTGGFTTALIVFIGYWLINGTLSNIVAPRIYGKGLNLSPVVTFVAVLFWGVILGPIGAMLAVPLTAIINSVILAAYPETQWLSILLREGDGAG